MKKPIGTDLRHTASFRVTSDQHNELNYLTKLYGSRGYLGRVALSLLFLYARCLSTGKQLMVVERNGKQHLVRFSLKDPS